MGAVVFPSSLPNPSVIGMSPNERRLLTAIAEGMPQVRPLQQDFLGFENLQWEFDATQSAVFQLWWVNALLRGGRWFQASWPRVSVATSGVCRFLLPPKWDEIGHERWRVTVGTELRGVALPPITASLQLGLHFDGDYADIAAGHSTYLTNRPGGYTDPVLRSDTPKFGSGYIRTTIGSKQIYSDNRGNLIFNADGEFQISVWVKPVVGGFGTSGGGVVELISWSHPSGGSFVGTGGTNPPGPYTGQFRLWVRGDASNAFIFFQYPTIDPSTGFFSPGILRDLNHFAPVGVPIDGAWHHVGIAGDVNGIRAYIDGTQVMEDGSTNYLDPSNPGARPMWAGTIYADQRFMVGGSFAGAFDITRYTDGTWPYGMAVAVPYCGDMEELEVRNGSGSVTYVGPTITVPVTQFVR